MTSPLLHSTCLRDNVREAQRADRAVYSWAFQFFVTLAVFSLLLGSLQDSLFSGAIAGCAWFARKAV